MMMPLKFTAGRVLVATLAAALLTAGGCGNALTTIFGPGIFTASGTNTTSGTSTATTGVTGVTTTPTDNTTSQSFDFTATADNATQVSIINPNGSITVNLDNTTPTVHITGIKQATDSAQFAEMQILAAPVPQTPAVFQVQVVFPVVVTAANDRVDLVVTLPQGFALDLNAQNGAITVTQNAGNVRARTSNGLITVTRTTGDVDAATSNANMILTNLAGSVLARTTNGTIRAAIAPPSGGSINLSTTNANIDLTVPFGTPAQLVLVATNGTVNTNMLGFFAINTQSTAGSVTSTLSGGGATRIVATTTNATITFGGGPVSP